MSRNNIISVGTSLVHELRKLATNYHEKSDKYEFLYWESVGIETRINLLKNNEIEKLKSESKENNHWGEEVVKFEANVAKKITAFYTLLYTHANS